MGYIRTCFWGMICVFCVLAALQLGAMKILLGGGDVTPVIPVKRLTDKASIDQETDISRMMVPKTPDVNCTSFKQTIFGIPDVMTSRNCLKCSDYSCGALLFNNTYRIHKSLYADVKKWVVRNIKRKQDDSPAEHILDDTDCKNYVTTVGYHVSSSFSSEEERQFPLAYNVLMYKQLGQMEQLLKAIYRPHNSYCIHVDEKAPAILHKRVKLLTHCLPNVHLASETVHVNYAGWSRLKADMVCMEDQLKYNVNWKYLLNLASEAHPLKTNAEIVKILKVFNGSNDVEGIYMNSYIRERINHIFKEDANGVHDTGKNNTDPPHNITIVKGSAYGTFSREFVEFMVKDKRAQDLLDWSKTTLTPDEHYFATLHHLLPNPSLNSPGGYKGEPMKKPWLSSYSEWGNPCFGLRQKGYCVFGTEDLPNLVKRKELFVNKLVIDYDPVALECLGRWIEYKAVCPEPLDLDYYTKLPFTGGNKASSHKQQNHVKDLTITIR